MLSKARSFVPLVLGILLASGLPARAARKAKPMAKPEGYRYLFEKGKIYHYTVTSHEEFKETDNQGSVTQRVYDGVWKSDLIPGGMSGGRTPVVVDTRLGSLKLTSFLKDGKEGPPTDRAELENALSGEDKRIMNVEVLDDFGANEEGKGVVQGAYYHVFLGGFDATVLPQFLPKPNRPFTREGTYGMGRYTFAYKISPRAETRLGKKCVVITGEASVSSPDVKSEYPRSTGYRTKLWFSPSLGRMIVLEVQGTIQFFPQEERMKKVTVEFAGEEDLGPKLGRNAQAAKAFYDGLTCLGEKRTLAVLERFSTLSAYSTSDLAQGVHDLLMGDLYWQVSPTYPQADSARVEADVKADPSVLERLIERAPEARLRALAAYYLGLSHGTRDVELLTAALQDTSPQARWEASGALLQKNLQGIAVPDTALILMFKSHDPILVSRGAVIAARTQREKLLSRYRIKYDPCHQEKPPGYRMKDVSVPASQVETWRQSDGQSWATRRVGIVEQEFTQGDLKGTYALYIPESYCESRPYPLILSLAGGGGNGEEMIGDWPNAVADKGYFVACPVAGGKSWWQEGSKIALAALADAKRKYNIDENRVYLTGYSNGGLGTDYLATRYPDLFAAAAPIAGNPVNDSTRDDDPAMLRNLRHVPFRIMHGEVDPVIPVGADRVMKARLDSLGFSAEYLETKGQGHGLRFEPDGRVKDFREALTFFAKHTRDPFPKRISGVMTSPGWRYWIYADSLTGKAHLEGEVKPNNVIDLKADSLARLTLFLNPKLVDFSKPLTVIVNGKQTYKGTLQLDMQVLIEAVQAREDRTMAFWAKLPLSLR